MDRLNEKLLTLGKNNLFFLNQVFVNTVLGPAVIGVLIFGLFFDFSIIEPANVAWMLRAGGDGMQHYLGSYAFRLDSWHFPLTKTEYINYPEGISIIFTDSNPLLSMIAKSMKWIFPPEYQFFGIWFLLCWILQSVLGYLLIKKTTGNNTYALLSAALFCLLPTQFYRLGHANLVAFWIILWSLYVFVQDEWSVRKKERLYLLIFSLAALIHAYLMFMAIIVALTWYILQFIQLLKEKDYRKLWLFIGINAAYGALFIVLLWVVGYFYNFGTGAGTGDFGYYSMNLNAPFNAMGERFSKFMSPLPGIGGQYEGYQYLGVGFLLLLIIVAYRTLTKGKFHQLPVGIFYISACILFMLLKPHTVPFYEKAVVFLFFMMYGLVAYALYEEKQKTLLVLYIPATVCYLYSLSNKVAIGETVLCDIHLSQDAFYSYFLQTARSSGRFFWVTTLFLMVASLVLLYRYFQDSKKSSLFLCLLILLQYIDISVDGFVIASNDRTYNASISASSQQQMAAARSVNLLSPFNMKVAEVALMNKKPINNFYVAHESSYLTKIKLEKQQQQLQQNKFDKEDLYLVESPWQLPLETAIKVHGFSHGYLSITPEAYRPAIDTSVWVKHKFSDSLATLLRYIKNSPLVLIAVKDEASVSLPDFFKQQLNAHVPNRLTSIGNRDSYIAVFSYGKLMYEAAGHEALEYRGRWFDTDVYLKSAGFESGNVAVISINGIDVAFDHTGLNVAVLSESDNKEKIWDVIKFNTSSQIYNY